MAHRDSKSVAVRDFIVYNGLNVDGLQLEVYCNIDEPGDKYIYRQVLYIYLERDTIFGI